MVGGAAWERILFRHVLSQCISLAACTGRTIIVAKELFITVLPQQDSWGRMLVWTLLFHVHTHRHTRQLHLYLMNAEYCSDITPGFFFSKEVTCMGEKRMQLQPQPVIQEPGGLSTNCHNFMNSSELTAWVSLWPYKQTQILMWLHSLWLALESPTLRSSHHAASKACVRAGKRKPILEKLRAPESHPHGT